MSSLLSRFLNSGQPLKFLFLPTCRFPDSPDLLLHFGSSHKKPSQLIFKPKAIFPACIYCSGVFHLLLPEHCSVLQSWQRWWNSTETERMWIGPLEGHYGAPDVGVEPLWECWKSQFPLLAPGIFLHGEQHQWDTRRWIWSSGAAEVAAVYQQGNWYRAHIGWSGQDRTGKYVWGFFAKPCMTSGKLLCAWWDAMASGVKWYHSFMTVKVQVSPWKFVDCSTFESKATDI